MNRLLIIIPAIYQEAANIAAESLFGDGSELTFTVPLSQTGNLPATHFWAGLPPLGEVNTAKIYGMKETAFPDTLIFEWALDGEENKPNEILESLNLKRVGDI